MGADVDLEDCSYLVLVLSFPLTRVSAQTYNDRTSCLALRSRRFVKLLVFKPYERIGQSLVHIVSHLS